MAQVRRAVALTLALALAGALCVWSEDAPDPAGVGAPEIELAAVEPFCVDSVPRDHAVTAVAPAGGALLSAAAAAPDDHRRIPRSPRSPPVA